MDNLHIGVFGDSVLKGVVYDEDRQKYTLLAENAVKEVQDDLQIDIVNRARMGCTVTKGYSILQKDLETGHHYDAAVVEFGGNDCDYRWEEIAGAPLENHQPHTPLAQFRQSLEKMIQTLRSAHITPILMTMPPIDASRYFSFFTRNGLDQHNILSWLGTIDTIFNWHEQYDRTVREVARACACDVVDVRSTFLSENYKSCLCLDGIHPNAHGQQLIRGCFDKYAKEKLATSQG